MSPFTSANALAATLVLTATVSVGAFHRNQDPVNIKPVASPTPAPVRRPSRVQISPVRVVAQRKTQKLAQAPLVIYTEPHATVSLKAETAQSLTWSMIASDLGFVEFRNLKPGPYVVSASLDGFLTAEQMVGIFPEKSAVLSLKLEPRRYSFTVETNVKEGEVRFAPAQFLGFELKGSIKIRETGGYGVVSIVNGRAHLQNLLPGYYAVRVRGPECDRYRESVLAVKVPDDLENSDGEVSAKPKFEVDLEIGDSTRPNAGSDSAKQVTIAKQEFPTISFGKYYALVIGNDDYQNGIKPLKNAINDATAVHDVLRTKFGFESILLTNRKGQEIISAINKLKRDLTENDNLLVYYSGHGIRLEDETYWVPIDAVDDQDNTTWVSTSVHLVKNLKATRAKHVIVISDSCFAGTMTRDLTRDPKAESGENRQNNLQKIVDNVSRVLLASGGDEPVMDGGGGKHSIFTRALLEGLEKMDKKVFLASELFYGHIAERVSGSAKQTPEFSPIRDSGHVRGEFVFVRVQ